MFHDLFSFVIFGSWAAAVPCGLLIGYSRLFVSKAIGSNRSVLKTNCCLHSDCLLLVSTLPLFWTPFQAPFRTTKKKDLRAPGGPHGRLPERGGAQRPHSKTITCFFAFPAHPALTKHTHQTTRMQQPLPQWRQTKQKMCHTAQASCRLGRAPFAKNNLGRGSPHRQKKGPGWHQ